MPAVLNVKYVDGTSETYRIGPKALLAAEDALGPEAMTKPLRATFIAAWKQSKSTLPFDEWLDTVEDFEEEAKDATADPTVTAPSPDESPT